MWDRKGELVEEPNAKLLEARGRDPTENGFQVSASTSEHSRKRGVCDYARGGRK
jgi:hypothetical protein